MGIFDFFKKKKNQGNIDKIVEDKNNNFLSNKENAESKEIKPSENSKAEKNYEYEPVIVKAYPARLPLYLNENLSYNDIRVKNKGKITLKRIDVKQLRDLRALKNYVVLDLETTGLDRENDDIIEIGLVFIENRSIVSSCSTLVNPGRHIPSYISEINHITDLDVEGKPRIEEIIKKIWNKIDGNIVVGHNVTFDLSFIKREAEKAALSGNVRYVNTVSVSKAFIKDLPNYKLETLTNYLGIAERQEHRAESDAMMTNRVLSACLSIAEEADKIEKERKKAEKAARDAERKEMYGNSPLLDKSFVFTGYFKSSRSELENMVPTVGGLLRDKVSGKTNYLVLGSLEGFPDWAVERKFLKAKNLIEEGKQITIVSEQEFVEMINVAWKTLQISLPAAEGG